MISFAGQIPTGNGPDGANEEDGISVRPSQERGFAFPRPESPGGDSKVRGHGFYTTARPHYSGGYRSPAAVQGYGSRKCDITRQGVNDSHRQRRGHP